MNWFRNLSIVNKLLLSFALVGAMGGAIFVCGVIAIQAMARSNTALYEHWRPRSRPSDESLHCLPAGAGYCPGDGVRRQP
jgi:hypothetical protein